MRFLKNRQDYSVGYNKKQAIKMLKEDSRVESVTSAKDKMVIKTNPITPTTREGEKVFLCPIGRYRITITEGSYLEVNIKRIGGSIMSDEAYMTESTHIAEGFGTDGICWGSVEEEIEMIMKNKDWYWLGKRCIDLLEDGKPEGRRYGADTLKLLFRLQAKYAKENNQKYLIPKLEDLLHLKMRPMGYKKIYLGDGR